MTGPREDRPDTWASEVGDFAYCARGWWLKRVAGHKAQGDQLGVGTAAHENVGTLVAGVVTIERVVRILAMTVGIIAIGVVVLLLSHLGS
ncbi:MAG: hypothetical protein ACHQ7N_22000 [Candidatus Methylomirabilales bacterium]